MSIYEFFHYSLFPGLFLAFTYNKKRGPVFGAAPALWCTLLSSLGLLFRHIPNNLSNYNVLTANAPFLYQISGTWSNHEGSILSWCRIPSFYRFIPYYRAQRKNVSKRYFFLSNASYALGGPRESLFSSFVSNFAGNSILSISRFEKKSGTGSQLDTSFVRLTPLDYEGEIRVKRTHHHSFLHLVRDDKERALSMDEERIDGALGIAFFFSPFLSASSDPFVRNLFVCTEPLAESNPVSQDPISAIHPPCIYAGEVASAMGFGLCRSEMISASPKNGRLLRKDTTPLLYWTAGKNTAAPRQRKGAIRIWVLTSRGFLTVGILLGSWWAHHELGWGGWWFWDPVENASFMPWVLATACIHSVILPILHSWTFLLTIVTFLCCVSGTFSIRSGLLASVHTFATDDTRGVLLWKFFLLMTVIAIIIFYQMKREASFRRIYKRDFGPKYSILCTYVTRLASPKPYLFSLLLVIESMG